MNNPIVVRRTWWTLIVAFLVLTAAGCSSGAEEADVEQERPGLLALEPFLTNINDPTGDRYCKLSVKLALVPKDKVAAIEEDVLLQARIRDQILTLVTAKTYHELNDPERKEAFRDEIRTSLAKLLKGAEIQEVLFSEFVVQ